MAYTSVIPVRRLKGCVDYVLDEAKTSRGQNAKSLEEAVDYALNRAKTEQDLFESAIACTCKTAFEDMCQVKEMWHKTGGVQGFHLVQSFAAGEVTPELAHQNPGKIGCSMPQIWTVCNSNPGVRTRKTAVCEMAG